MMVMLWIVLVVSVNSTPPFYKRWNPAPPSAPPRPQAPHRSRPNSRINNVQAFTRFNGNMAVDIILGVVTSQLKQIGRDVIEIPEINQDYDFWRFEGTFQINGGRIENLASIYRTTDAIIKEEANGHTTLTAGFGFRTLAVRIDEYIWKLNTRYWKEKRYKKTWKGKMSAQITRNSVKAEATVKLKNNGIEKLKVNYVKFNELNGIRYKITGLGLGNILLPGFLDDVTTIIRSFKYFIEREIKKQVNKSLEEQGLLEVSEERKMKSEKKEMEKEEKKRKEEEKRKKKIQEKIKKEQEKRTKLKEQEKKKKIKRRRKKNKIKTRGKKKQKHNQHIDL